MNITPNTEVKAQKSQVQIANQGFYSKASDDTDEV